LVKLIVTVPAFAVSDVLSYLSCPEVFAARLSDVVAEVELAAVEDVLAGVEDVLAALLDVLALVSGVAAAGALVLELLEELPPQPASTNTSAVARSGTVERRNTRALATAAAVELKVFLQSSGSLP
jgi:hypothetical protein